MLRSKLLAVLSAAALIGIGVPAPGTASPFRPGVQAVAAKSCGAGYRSATINGHHKCLRRGEFCVHSADRQYRRYGFRCTRYYANVGRYRLT